MAKKQGKKAVETPLMKQYYSIKDKHPDAILLFRVGDFYETFEEDAVKASSVLGITLTKRANGAASYVDLAGFPHHALDTYLPKLVRAGLRVAVCEQLEDPKLTKKIVKRGVTELVTPGVSINDNILSQKENNFVAAIHFGKKTYGISFLDISTGEFYTSQGNASYCGKLIQSMSPKEILVERNKLKEFQTIFGNKYYTYALDDWMFTEDAANERLLKQFNTKTLKGFGIEQYSYGIISAGAVLYYLDITHNERLGHITAVSRLDEDDYVWLDRFSIRNLELFHSLHEEGSTLLDVIDKCKSPMGSRMLKKWLSLPLKDLDKINQRQSIVEYFINENTICDKTSSGIEDIGDLERLISKAAVGRINPREIIQLKKALFEIENVKELLENTDHPGLKNFAVSLTCCLDIRNRIEREIVDDPPVQLNKGRTFKDGVNNELDELRKIVFEGKDYLLNLQENESKRTGIPSLKIGFNNVFGYYIEVRNTHKEKVPEEWIRKQTLVSAERYITEELKEYESKILGAEDKISDIEQRLYQDLILALHKEILPIQKNASVIASLDCLQSFAVVSKENNYCRPELTDVNCIDIKQGRHPVIEQTLPLDEEYVANDVFLDSEKQQVMIITGPNMVGKSALLRQTALIVIMAQIGCFVPAEKAEIGYVDKIFTRVGASDNISSGESTFMVEMNEAASILNNLSPRSLILLDEIGRGTSTYDGISIAWAIVEYIHEHPSAKAKTLFATHYHELNKMESSFDRIRNYNVSVKELNNKVIFIRKLVPGGTEHSFGIHVAKMAGMPKSVVSRANDILQEFEKSHKEKTMFKPVDQLASQREGYQLSFFQLEDPVLKQIRDEIVNLDVNNLTPIEALNKLSEIKRISGLGE
jgi:DNA mismatch repair protein MutS